MPVTRSRRLLALAGLSLLAAVLAACGGAYASSAGGASAAKKKGAAVKLRRTALGTVLVDAHGRTLYLYTPDRGGASTCYGGCASAWPPLLVKGRPAGAKGVRARLLGVTMRKDGSHQVTYAGHPLYRYAGDAKAGQVNGQAVGGIWWALSAAGKEIRKTAAAGTATTPPPATTTTSGYGGGY